MPSAKRYNVEFAAKAKPQFFKLDKILQQRLLTALELLADNPRPPKSMKLTGFPLWRIRIGDYRVIYNISDEKLTVLVIRIAHRKNVYDQLPKELDF